MSFVSKLLSILVCKMLFAMIILSTLNTDAKAQLPENVSESDTVATVPSHWGYSTEGLINVAYGRQEAKLLTSSVATLQGEALRWRTSESLANTFFGRLPGLSVLQRSGEPGNIQSDLLVRGSGTYHNSDVLILIDGFEAVSLDQVSAYEIESVQVLKDAAALVLYGMKGANGAILITTKRGFSGATQVDFSLESGFQQPTRLPGFVDSYNYARLHNEARINDGYSPTYSEADLSSYQSGGESPLHPNVNWFDEVLQDRSYTEDYKLSFRGGGDVATYFLHLGYLQDTGLYANTDNNRQINSNANFERYDFRSNIDIQITPRFRASLDLGGKIEERAYPNYDSTLLWENMARYPANAYPIRNPDDSWGGSDLYPDNPVASVQARGFNSMHDRILIGTLQLSQDLLNRDNSNLVFKQAISSHNWHRGNYNRVRDYAFYELSGTAGDLQYTQRGTDTEFSTQEGGNNQWNRLSIQAGLDYNLQLQNNQNVHAFLMVHQDVLYVSGGDEPHAFQNVMGRVNYNYQSRYVAELGFSLSGTDRFPEGDRIGFFPAVSVAWVLSNENFLADHSLFSFLKARASVGLIGNDRVPGARYAYNQNYLYSGDYRFGNNNTSYGAMIEGPLANPGVTWEKSLKYNAGLEMGVMNRLDISLDLFYEKRTDILASTDGTIPGYVGTSTSFVNAGKVNNRGFEANLFYHDQAGSMRYFVGGGISFNRSKIVEMNEVPHAYEWMCRTGNPVGQPFGLEVAGFYNSDDFDEHGNLKPDLSQPVFGPVRPGDFKYRDLNNDGIIDENDETAIGKPWHPEINYSFVVGSQYKGFDLELFFQGIASRSVYLSGPNFWAFQNDGNIPVYAMENRWTPENATNAAYPRLSSETNLNNYRPNDFWVQSGNLLRLRNIELGYTIPQSLAGKLRTSNARIFVRGINLFTWDEVDLVDPESMGGYPPMKSINLGAQLRF